MQSLPNVKKQREWEYQFKKNDVWDVVLRPEGKSIVTSKWIDKIEHAVDGNITGYKARFVAQGFSQKEGIDYEETFAASKSWNTYIMSLMKILTFNTMLKKQVYTLDGHIEY